MRDRPVPVAPHRAGARHHGPVRLEPITWERLADQLADRLLALKPDDGGEWPRVAFDGAPAARPGELARRVAEALRLRGRSVLVVAAGDFLRPASLRLEHGREDVESYYSGWFDTGALWREVFGPLDPGGSGRVLPDLWDPDADRATRSPYVELPPGGLLLLHGPLLLGHWFPFDLTVHLRLTPGALRRHTDPGEQWTLPAFERYEAEAAPMATADVVVRADDPRRPAWSG
ncbi:uridine kinase [Streptomyces sp. NPDC059009]|uniref:uridine kinase n=1 Tax=Streptomyces sp. NPDC059009 TaxID=3346694 RepID=UPI0036C24600